MLRMKTTQHFIHFLFGLLYLSVLGGCGPEISAAPAGVYIDGTTEEYLRKTFDETKECAQLPEGSFEEISVGLMPPTFPCIYYPDGCSGEYVEPNSIRVGSLYTWRHEVIHYLLYMNTGDEDPSHQSPLFNTCA